MPPQDPTYPSESTWQKISVFISKNIPYATAFVVRRLFDVVIAVRNFIVQMIHDTLGR